MLEPQNHPNPHTSTPQPAPASLASARDSLSSPGPRTAPSVTLLEPPCASSPLPAEPPPASALVTSAPSSSPPSEPSSEVPLLQFAGARFQPLQTRPAGKPRNGKIARLPKLDRDMVNRMLAMNLPHRKIVVALEERGYQVTERNVSNWKTRGGYHEWRAAQEHALELRTFQDNLTDFLRRHDAAELPEVGLQSAATSLSAVLLRPDLMRELVNAPEKYSKLIELQCRLAREIQALQKARDDAAISLGPRFKPERVKRQNEQEVERIRETMSATLGNSIREPDIPHRNFMPKELDPAPEIIKPLDPTAALQRFQALALGRLPAAAPSPKAARAVTP